MHGLYTLLFTAMRSNSKAKVTDIDCVSQALGLEGPVGKKVSKGQAGAGKADSWLAGWQPKVKAQTLVSFLKKGGGDPGESEGLCAWESLALMEAGLPAQCGQIKGP